MSRDLFAQDPSLKLGEQKWYTVPLSMLAHAVIIAAVVVIPLMATDVLPTPPGMMTFVTASPAPPPPPPPAPPPSDSPRPTTEPTNTSAAPIEAPRSIEPERSVVRNADVDPGVVNGINVGITSHLVEPPPPPPPSAPLRVGGQIRAPQRTRNVDPVYPSIAQSARVQGIVIIEATIAPDGHVQDAKVLRSIPLLDDAALAAVRQWQYTPTLLNGVPVPIIMTVTVDFRLR